MSDSSTYDAVVIGGGISGLGVAHLAAQKGYSVALYEKENFGGATSDNSLRIIHGGLRYLQNLDFSRTIESLKEQHSLCVDYPEVIKNLPCVMPLESFGMRSKIPAMLGALAYRTLNAVTSSGARLCGVISSRRVNQEIKILDGLAPHGCLYWTDAQMTSARLLTEKIVAQSKAAGAELVENCGIQSVEKNGSGFVLVAQTGKVLRSKMVVNTTGPWIAKMSRSLRPTDAPPVVWCKAFNLVLDTLLEPKYGIGLYGEENRLYFLVPRKDHSVLGTFYLPYSGDPKDVAVSSAEAAEALSGFRRCLPGLALSEKNIDRVEVGVLPARAIQASGPELFGSERISQTDGFIEVLSTKYTTFRSQARKVLALMDRNLR